MVAGGSVRFDPAAGDAGAGELEAAPLRYLFMHESIEQGVQALEGRLGRAMARGQRAS
jgi:hypothetical protein